MSWRSHSQRTGANESGLANPRRWGGPGSQGGGGGGGGGGYDSPSQSSYGGHPPPPPMDHSSSVVGPPTGERKRKSRWGDENDKIQVAGLPTAIAGNVQGKDLENYAIHVRLEEISRKIKSGDVVPPERERSPSPPPTYDHHGRRTNTREIRYKKKLEDERNRLVEKAMRNDPSYKPPTEYLMHKRFQGRPAEKIYIPIKEFPEIKWIGLILGPRGNSLKQMEKETGAKIVIRGKGSTKEGKGTFGSRSADEDDELHCNITADSQDKVDACAKLINKVIATAASTPDEQNDHKRMQLRELAMLNGTLRDDENQPCQNCGKLGHRKYDCPEQRNFTANVVCRNCGNMGHMARDCIAHRSKPGGPGSGMPGGPGGPGAGAFDSEYSALMAELGEGPVGGLNGPGPGQQGGPDAGHGTPGGMGGQEPLQALPPWRVPSNWQPPRPVDDRRGGFGGDRDRDRQGPGGGMNYGQQYGSYAAQAGYGQQSYNTGGYDYSTYYGAQQQQQPQSAYGTAGYGASYA